jgi:hypothetical protein
VPESGPGSGGDAFRRLDGDPGDRKAGLGANFSVER